MTTVSLISRQLGGVRIERLIGQGEMGEVYAGTDLRLQRPVALKVIATRAGGGLAYARRLNKAAQLIAAWQHPHIMPIYATGSEDGLFYLVMPYVEGQDLASLLGDYRADGLLPPHEHVLLIGKAIASALDYAHQQGIVHRAVKPSNVLISADDRILLGDFGLALDQREGTAGNVFLSSHYSAPEQLRSSAAALPQSDLYSLGVILYEMLTGVLPFSDRSPVGVALQHMTQPPSPPRQINPDLSAETEAVLLTALSKQPEQRFPSGAALLQALESALQRKPARSLREAGASALQHPAAPQSTTDPLIGTQLDSYRVEALLGKGGMARIYRGHDLQHQRAVAIKVIDPPFQNDPDYTMRFEREAQAIAQLDHPNIVHLYYYGECRGLLYMVMQYVEGRDLETIIASLPQRRTLLDPQAILKIVRNICYALDYAHSKGVIHRDVTPANILVDDRGRAILTDFGLALVTAIGTRGEIFGTPHYIAPEQAMSSAQATPRSDLYAVGVILYELLTGERPFDGPSPIEIALAHISKPHRPARELRPDLSTALEAVLNKALAKDPRDRYGSGAELAAAVAQLLPGA